MEDTKVFTFPDAGAKSGGIDASLLALLQNNGGLGGNNAIWLLFLWMMWAYNGNGNGLGNNGGIGYLSNQINNDQGRDLLLQAINGRADALSQLAQITNSNVNSVRDVLGQIQLGIQQTTAQVGKSGLEIINALQLGNAGLAQQLCQCCCENRLAIANQTNEIQRELAANHAQVMLENAKAEAADQLAVCQQTNQLGSQADRNTNSILNAIFNQNTLITKEFCELKERELQSKIDTQSDIINQLRGQVSNDKQTEHFNAAFAALNEKINALAAKQPNTVPVQYPNIVAANATPYVGYGYGYGQTNFWN